MKKIVIICTLLFSSLSVTSVFWQQQVSCSQYWSNANSCDQCFDGGSKYTWDVFKPYDVFNAWSKDRIYYYDENPSNYSVSTLGSSTNWYVSNNLLQYPSSLDWQISSSWRDYLHLRANTSTRILETQNWKWIRLQSVSWTPSPYDPALKFTFTVKARTLISQWNVGSIVTHRECIFYKPNYCWDGILQANKWEVCDPNDSTQRGWGSGGCSVNTCTPIEATPVCNSLTVNRTSGEAPTSVTATCSGFKVNTYKIDCGNGQVFTGNGNNSGNQSFSNTCNYNSDGTFTPTCTINGSITNNSCRKSVNITDPINPSIVVDKRDQNVSDLDGTVWNDTQTVNQGENSVFQITVANNGPEALRNVTLNDPMEASCNRDASQTSSLISNVWNRNNYLDPGESFSYTCSKSNTQSNYTNTISVNATWVTSGKNTNDSDPTVVIVVPVSNPSPWINVDKRDANNNDLDGSIGWNDSQTVNVWDTAVFSITVRNTGTEDLRDIILTDAQAWACESDGIVNLSGKNFQNKDGDTISIAVSGVGNNNDDIFQVWEIFTYSCEKTNTRSSYTNLVAVSGVWVNSGINVTDSDPTEIVIWNTPSIQVIKEDANSNDLDGVQFNDTQTVTQWSEAIFHITVKNNGAEDLRDITLTDVRAESCASSGSVNLTGASFINRDNVAVTIFFGWAWDHNDNIFQVGEEFTYTCNKWNTQANYTNIVEVSWVWVTSGTVVTDDDPTEVIVQTPAYDLALNKVISTMTPGPFTLWETVTFTITVFNQGTFDSGEIEITDYIPDGLTLNDSAWTQVWSNATRTISNIAPGWNTPVNITFTINSNAPNSITNFAEISSDNGNDCDSTRDSINGNGAWETVWEDLIDNAIGTACEPGGDEDDHDLETITLTNPGEACTNLSASPSSGQNVLTSTLICTWNNATTYKIEVKNAAGNVINTIDSANGSVTLDTVGTYTASCFINGATTTSNSCQKTLSVTPTTSSTSSWGGGTVSCSDIIKNNDSSYTCYGNNRTRSIALQCGSDVDGNPQYLPVAVWNDITREVSGRRTATFNCSDPNPTCYVKKTEDTTISASEIGSWTTSAACEVQQNPICGDGIVQPERGEQCDLGSLNGTTTACSWTCGLNSSSGWGWSSSSNGGGWSSSSGGGTPLCSDSNSCVLTFPNGWELTFGPEWSEIIGHNVNPLDSAGTPFLYNNSDYDLSFDKFCIKRTSSDSVGGSTYALTTPHSDAKNCIDLGNEMIYAYERIEFADYNVFPNFTGNKAWVSGVNYGDAILTTSLEDDIDGNGVIDELYEAYFAADLNIRVAKPAVVSVGWGTSYVKDSSTTSDIYEVTRWITAQENKNFVWASASDSTISSYTNEVTNTDAIANIQQENSDYISTVESVTNTTTTTLPATTWYTQFTNYNGLQNVFILTGRNVTLSDIPTLTESRTYIIEGGNLTIDGDMITNQNIAFVVKGGDIRIKSAVKRMDGTYISIPGTSRGWNISSEASADQLVVNGSLYGDLTNLVDNRYYISQDAGQFSVGTIVSFGSSIFTKPAPLVSQFIEIKK